MKSEHTFSYQTNKIKRTWNVIDIWDYVEENDFPSLWVDLSLFDLWDSIAWGGGMTYGEFLEHHKRVLSAQVSFPVIILNDEFLKDSCIVDGHHRIIKLKQADMNTVKAIELNWEQLLSIKHNKKVSK